MAKRNFYMHQQNIKMVNEEDTNIPTEDELYKITQPGYDAAIKHYNLLRINFLNKYGLDSQQDNNIANETMIDSIIKEIESNSVGSQRNVIDKKIIPVIERAINKAFNSGNVQNRISEIRQAFLEAEEAEKSDSEEKKKKANQTLQELSNKIFNDANFERNIRNSIKDNLVTGSVSYADLYSQARAMRLSMLKSRILDKKSDIWLQRSIIAGFYRESVVASAFAKRMGKVAKQVGNQKVSKIISGKKYTVDTGIDILIGEVDNIGDTLKKLEGSESENINLGENPLNVYGIQVKSWTSDYGKPYNLSISSKKNIHDKLQNHVSWIEGAYLLSKKENILDALGQNNVAWVTGDKFYFTDDFIKFYRNQHKYFLNFIYSKDKKSSQKVRWQKYMQYFN